MSTISNQSTNTDTETRILKAAEQEFFTKGLAGARTTTIAEAAGVTHAMLHYYFRTKEKLFERIVSEKFNLAKQAVLVPLTDLNLSLEEIIRRVIDRHISLIADNPGLPQFIVSELFRNPGRYENMINNIEERAQTIIQILQHKIDAAAESGEIRRVDARMLILDIVSLNIFPFMAAPLIDSILNISPQSKSSFLEQRKQENFHTIMRKLKI